MQIINRIGGNAAVYIFFIQFKIFEVSAEKNAHGDRFSWTHQRCSVRVWLMRHLLLLIEPTLFWDQGLLHGSTCGLDLHSALHYQRSFRVHWHPKCWSQGLKDVSLEKETVTFALFMCLVFRMLIVLLLLFFPAWHMAALITSHLQWDTIAPDRDRKCHFQGEQGQLLFYDLVLKLLNWVFFFIAKIHYKLIFTCCSSLFC